MENRLKLHELLVSILGTRNVYYQPPESIKMNYPALVYSRASIDNSYADDNVYKQNKKYRVTIIDANPDSVLVTKLSQFKTAKFERHYVSNNLNHDSFLIYY